MMTACSLFIYVALILPNEYLPLKYAYNISPQSSKFGEINYDTVEYAVDL